MLHFSKFPLPIAQLLSSISMSMGWILYNTAGWLSYTKQNPATQNAPRLLQDSQK